MQRLCAISFSVLLLVALGVHKLRADPVPAGITGRVVKVLPFFLDTNNAVATSPSLFDRDAYQARLRRHPDDITGIRFDVMWKAHDAHGTELTLRLELRGIGAAGLPTQLDVAKAVTPGFFHHWTSLTLNGPAYKQFGELAAWRATLWDGNRLLGEQKSFLWSL
jgi:hypothetical protein